MDVGTRSSAPRRLREDLRTTRGDKERTAATLVLTNQGTARSCNPRGGLYNHLRGHRRRPRGILPAPPGSPPGRRISSTAFEAALTPEWSLRHLSSEHEGQPNGHRLSANAELLGQ